MFGVESLPDENSCEGDAPADSLRNDSQRTEKYTTA